MDALLQPANAAIWAVAYLAGGIPFGLLVARLRGVDIRRHGSGNIGATNVGRLLGRPWGVLVFLLDAGKCFGVMQLAARCAALPPRDAGAAAAAWMLLVAGLLAVTGSVAPIYLRFRGGKAVAATIGVMLGVWPYLALPALGCLVLWLAAVWLTRYVSLASIIAGTAHPLLMALCIWRFEWRLAEIYPLLILSVAAAVLIVVRHRTNISRLLAGTEQRVGDDTRSVHVARP